MYYFEKVCEFLEQEVDLYTLKEIHLKMCDLAGSTNVCTAKWLKNKRNINLFDKIKGFAIFGCFK